MRAWSGGPEGLSCPAAAALAGSWEKQAAILPSDNPQPALSKPRSETGSRKHPRPPPEHTGCEAGAMQALLRCHHGGAERGSPNVWMEGKAPEHILDWLSQGMPSDWIPTFTGEHLVLKIWLSMRKGSECFGSRGSLEGFPVAFQAAWCDVAFCCVI